MTSLSVVPGHQPTFDEVTVGDAFDTITHGPLDIIETVRWAGVQENIVRIHYDREFSRERGGQRSFIASGSYRQALIGSRVTSWMGPRGRLRTLSMRNVGPTVEGDLMLFDIAITAKSEDQADPWVTLSLEGRNQSDAPILHGSCTVVLPLDSAG